MVALHLRNLKLLNAKSKGLLFFILGKKGLCDLGGREL